MTRACYSGGFFAAESRRHTLAPSLAILVADSPYAYGSLLGIIVCSLAQTKRPLTGRRRHRRCCAYGRGDSSRWAMRALSTESKRALARKATHSLQSMRCIDGFDAATLMGASNRQAFMTGGGA